MHLEFRDKVNADGGNPIRKSIEPILVEEAYNYLCEMKLLVRLDAYSSLVAATIEPKE